MLGPLEFKPKAAKPKGRGRAKAVGWTQAPDQPDPFHEDIDEESGGKEEPMGTASPWQEDLNPLLLPVGLVPARTFLCVSCHALS